MSNQSVRASLTQQATIQRNTSTTVDDFNRKTVEWSDLSTVPCFMWTETGSQVIANATSGVASLVTEEGLRMILALGIDVTPADRISDVTYRGDSITDTPLNIQAVLRHEDHLELVLERVS